MKYGLLMAFIVAGIAGLVFQHHKNALLQGEIDRLRAQVRDHSGREAKKSPPAESPTSEPGGQAQLELLRKEIAELRQSPANSWEERANRLRLLLDLVPGQSIPEIQLATEEDWLDAAKGELVTVDDYRRALALLRNTAIRKFVVMLRPALNKYLQDHAGKFPLDPSQLQTYLDRPMDHAIWQRYEVVPAAAISNIKMGGGWAITQKSPVDEEYDLQFVIGSDGYGSRDYYSVALRAQMAPVIKAFSLANPGKNPTDVAQLLPYATTPEQQAAIQKAMQR